MAEPTDFQLDNDPLQGLYDQFSQDVLGAGFLPAMRPPPPPEVRGYLGQVGAGVARGAAGIGVLAGQAVGLPVPTIGKGIEDFFSRLQPAPSGGLLEQGVETAVTSVGALASVTGALALSPLTASTGLIVGGTAALFGAAEATRTRELLGAVNQQLIKQGQEPLSQADITEAMAANALIEGAGEGVANFLFAKRFGIGSGAFQAAKQSMKNFITPQVNQAVGRVGKSWLTQFAKETALSAAREGSTEALQAAGQAGVIRGTVGEERVGGLRQQGVPLPAEPAQEALEAAKVAAAAAPFFVAGGRIMGARPQPQEQGATAAQAEPTPRAQGPLLPPDAPRPTSLVPQSQGPAEIFAATQQAQQAAEAVAQPDYADQVRQSVDRIVQTDDGRYGVVYRDNFGITHFQASGTDIPVDDIPRVTINGGEFETLFGSQERGVDPEAIIGSQEQFLRDEGLSGLIPEQELERAAEAGTPETPRLPLPERRKQAQSLALDFVIARQEQGFDDIRTNQDEFRTAIRQLAEVSDLSEPQAKDILLEAMDAGRERLQATQARAMVPRQTPEPVEVSDQPAAIDAPVSPPQATPPIAAPPLAAQVTQTAATAPIPATEGVVATVRTPTGREVQTRFVVVEAADLVTSNDNAGNPTPGYPQELQPRDRTRISSQAQIADMIQNLDPEQLGESRLASTGAPIVGADQIVESGNGRVSAIRQSYQLGHPSGQSYRQFLERNIERFGLSPEQLANMEQPVLVRVRRSELSGEERQAFTKEAGIDVQQAMSASEMARGDARRLTPAMISLFNPTSDGNVGAPQNRTFVREFLGTMASGERASLITADGTLSQTGITRIRNAVFARAYGNVAILERLAEDPDSSIRNITTAMLLAAPDFVRMKALQEQGALFPIDPTPQIAAAANKLGALRDQNETVEGYLRQGGLFGEELDPLSKDILRLFDANKRSIAKIAGVLQKMPAVVDSLGDPRQVSMLGGGDLPTPAEVFEAALRTAEADNATTIPLRAVTADQPDPPGSRQETPVSPKTQATAQAGVAPPTDIDLSGMGEAISENLVDRLWQAVQQGETQEAGQDSVYLQVAKQIKNAGGLASREDLKRVLTEISTIRDQFSGQDYQQALRELVARETTQAAPLPFTLEQVKGIFSGQAFQITQNNDGTVTIATRQGAITLRGVEQLAPDQAAIQLSYGRQMQEGEQAVGRFQQVGEAQFEIAVTPEATEEVLRHEAGHFFEDAGVLTNDEIAAINKALRARGDAPTPETRADFIADALNQAAPKGALGRGIAKAQRFFDRMAQLAGIQTAGQVVRRVQRGELTGVDQVNQQGQMIQRFALRTIPDTIEGVTVETADKAFLDYKIAADMADRAGVTDALSDAAFRKLKISWGQLDEISQRILTRWMTEEGEFRKFLNGLKSPDFTISPAAMWAFAKWEQAMFHDAQTKLQSGEITQEDYQARVDHAVRLSLSVPGASEFGRGLAAAGKFQAAGNYRFADYISRLEKAKGKLEPGQLQAATEAYTTALQSGEPDAMLALFEESTDPKLVDYYMELYYGSLLSGIPTQITNTVGTLAHLFFQDGVVGGTMALLDASVAKITGQERSLMMREVVAGMGTALRGMPRAYKEAWYWWKSPFPTRLGGEGQQRPVPAALQRGGMRGSHQLDMGHAQAWARAPGNNPIAKTIRGLAPFVSAASRLLSAMDAAAKTVAYDAQVERGALQEARKRGLPEDQIRAFVSDVHANSTQFPEIHTEAMRIKDVRTFNDTPGTLANILLSTRKVPFLGHIFRLLTPFASTPDRLLARGLELLPGIGMVVSAQENGLSLRDLGDLKNPKVLEMHAKQLVGLMLTALAATLWDDDKLTGPVPEFPNEREAFYRKGLLPFSIILGEHVVQYRRVEPMLSIPFGFVTSAFEAHRTMRNKRLKEGLPLDQMYQEDGTAIAFMAVGNMIKFVMDSSYFSGLANFFSSIEGRQGSFQHGLSRQLVSATVPFISLQRNISRAIEATGLIEGTEYGEVAVRSSKTLGESYRTAIPGIAQGVRARTDLFGRQVTQRTSPLEALLSPIQHSRLSEDPVEARLGALGMSPGVPTRVQAQGNLRRRISNDEYQAFLQRRGEVAKQQLDRLIGMAFFSRMPEDRQRQRIKTIFTRATRQARREVLQQAASPYSFAQ